jgi:hypothetical protein
MVNFQQVHITQGDLVGKAVIVSWVTVQPSAPKVWYGIKQGDYSRVKQGQTTRYKFYNYTSGFIHRVTLNGLQVPICFYFSIAEHLNKIPKYQKFSSIFHILFHGLN